MPDEKTPPKTAWVTSYGNWIVARRWPVILVATLIVAILSAGMLNLSVNPDSRVYFGKDDPYRVELDRLENTYNKANNVFIIVTAKDGNLFTRPHLAAIEALTKAAWKTPFSLRVDSMANYQHSYAKGDEIIVESLYKNAPKLTDAQIATVKSRALESKELVGRLVSKTGDVAGINIIILMPGKSRTEVVTTATFARKMVEDARKKYPSLEFRLTGGVMGDVAFKEAGELDLMTLVPIMIAIILAILWLGFRSVGGTAATVMVIVFSVGVALGIAGWWGLVLNPGTAATPIIIMTLCIADCVHLMTTLAQLRKAGLGMKEAVVESMRINAGPVAITSLTTAFGFITLNFGGSPPLADLGNMVALGMVAAFLLSVTFFPAVLTVLPAAKQERPWTGEALTAWIARAVLARRRLILIVSLVVFALGGFGVSRLTLDDNLIRYFDSRFEFRRATDYLQERLTGLNVLSYSLQSGKEQGITQPEYLRALDAFAAWYEKQPGVAHVSTISTTIKRLNKSSHGDDPKYDRIPDDPKLAAQLLLFYELSLPFGRDMKDQIDIGKSASRVNVFLTVTNAADIRRLAAEGEAWLKKNAPKYYSPATGLSIVYAHISAYNVRSMIGGTLVALLLISVTMIFVLKSLKFGVLSLVPNMTPVFIAFGFWGYIFQNVNLAVSVVGAITLGIVVDDTIHFLSKYTRARQEKGMSPKAAVTDTFRTVGNAMILTTVALVLGFSVLILSGFAISKQMGFLSAVTLTVALIADLTLTPVLMLLLDREKKPAPAKAPAESDKSAAE